MCVQCDHFVSEDIIYLRRMIAVAILLLALSSTEALEVNLTGAWERGVGWQLSCSWSFPLADRLQSVRLSRDGAQFKIYRPENHGPRLQENFYAPDSSLLKLDCVKSRGDGGGECILIVEPLAPPTGTVTYSCEVSGERPTFNVNSREYQLEPYVPSNDAHAEASINLNQSSGRVTLNCTASGLPAPQLMWKVNEQTVPSDFADKAWNASTKLYHVWSTVSLTPTPGQILPVICVPEQRHGKEPVLGPPSEYLLQEFRSSGGTIGDDFRIPTLLLASLFYLR